MAIFDYTQAHNEFRERLRKFIESDITPNADQWEQDHIVPKSAWKQMGEAGFLCTEVPKDYGGHGKDFLYSVIVTEEMIYANQTGLAAYLHSDIIVPYITAFGSEEIKKKYKLNSENLTEDNYRELFLYLHQDKIHKDILIDVLIDMIKGKFNLKNYESLSTEDVHKTVKEIVKKNPHAPFGALMGQCMKALQGKVSGKIISDELKKLL